MADMIDSNVTQVSKNTQTEMMVNRQAQEVQAAIVIAKRFPRDEYDAINRIKRACKRPKLAEQSLYSYSRGNQNVTGPSIRLAEAIAQSWGNIDYGILELEQKDGKSEMMAYAWDLETNTRVTKIFGVEHKRDTKKGSYTLTDSRDVYELTANFGARRVRACILGVIPGDIVDMAVEECRDTQKAEFEKIPSLDKIEKIEKLFKKDFNVTREQIEKYIGQNMAQLSNDNVVDLWGVYNAIKNGQAKIEDYFQIIKEEPTDPFKKEEPKA
jgi:hypothetical protein